MERTSEEMIDIGLLKQIGFPTFDEYKKNPDKWRKGIDEIFEAMEKSTQVPSIRKQLSKQKYWWRNQYKCDSIEKLQRVIKEEGYSGRDIEMCPMKILMDGTDHRGRVEFVIQVWPRWEWEMMGKVSTNNDG